MTVTPIATPSRRIAAEIRAEAARQGVSIREVARRLGVSQPWVSRRVSVHADVDLTFEELDRIAEVLGVSAADLMAAAHLGVRGTHQYPNAISEESKAA